MLIYDLWNIMHKRFFLSFVEVQSLKLFHVILGTKHLNRIKSFLNNFCSGGDLTDSTEALSTILAYKGEEGTEKEEWNPPRPNPPQQRINKLNDKKSKPRCKPYFATINFFKKH